MFHSVLWGGWAFDVESFTPSSMISGAAVLGISGGQQTGQQGSPFISGNNFFVENIAEEVKPKVELLINYFYLS